ncbi:4-(cytidine 5'-diphospho)-2-C-methyl-D-erythritol kinase [Marinobacteraceae bacterium S3BR75-40.1]
MHPDTFTLPAPAKLNLFLHILGRREDGFHELQTLFQLLDYGDDLHFRLREDEQIAVTPALPDVAPEDNLIYRAAAMLRDAANKTLPGVSIQLDKRLPLGGGLGGGSSDAATTLLALNRLWHLDWPLEQLADMGCALGADVPVFVHGHTAWGEGIGEKLTPVQVESSWYLVLKPDCEVSTPRIFKDPGLTRDTAPLTIAPAFDGNDPQYRNDCEPVVKHLYPQVEDAMNWLSQFGETRLTGTGSCVFGRFPTKFRAQEVLASKPSGIKGFVAKGLDQSPVHKRLSELFDAKW